MVQQLHGVPSVAMHQKPHLMIGLFKGAGRQLHSFMNHLDLEGALELHSFEDNPGTGRIWTIHDLSVEGPCRERWRLVDKKALH